VDVEGSNPFSGSTISGTYGAPDDSSGRNSGLSVERLGELQATAAAICSLLDAKLADAARPIARQLRDALADARDAARGDGATVADLTARRGR
jgi:hypothetical protein